MSCSTSCINLEIRLSLASVVFHPASASKKHASSLENIGCIFYALGSREFSRGRLP